MWLDEFRSFTQLIRKLTKTASSGTYVATTDVANFYDSIEIPRLIERLRRDMPSDSHEEIELLEVFLGLWDRRTTGYSRSSKGIPQEIISDGSRFLSHYYLQDFDEDFGQYCELPPEIRTVTQATICSLLIFDEKEIRDVET
ncbi:hypothetical protein C0U40_19895, partial [Amylibacter cionae]